MFAVCRNKWSDVLHTSNIKGNRGFKSFDKPWDRCRVCITPHKYLNHTLDASLHSCFHEVNGCIWKKVLLLLCF